MTKFLIAIAFTTTLTFLWLSADSVAQEAPAASIPHLKFIGPRVVVEKKKELLKVPANTCILNGEEPGQILEDYVRNCVNRRHWLNIKIVNDKGQN